MALMMQIMREDAAGTCSDQQPLNLTARPIGTGRWHGTAGPSDSDFDAELDRIEYAITQRPDRTFAFDEFGPLGFRPTAGSRPDQQANSMNNEGVFTEVPALPQ